MNACDGSGTRNWIFGYLELDSRKMGVRQVEQGFSSFNCKYFGILYNFSKFHSSFSALFFEKSSNANAKSLVKNEEKPCSTYLQYIYPWRYFQNPDFRYYVHTLFLTNILYIYSDHIHL